MSTSLPAWSVRAVNLPEHADNPVHTHAGGLAAGFEGALVAGTTVYAYLTRPVLRAWGLAWVAGGRADVRFHSPVLADALVEVEATERNDGLMVEATSASRSCATALVQLRSDGPGAPVGRRLEPLVEVLDAHWTGYAGRVGADVDFSAEHDGVHPVVWLALANRVFAAQLVDGPWVHTGSIVRHLGTAAPGDTVVVECWLVDRFTTRAGARATADVRVSIDGRPVAAIEHEAIVRLGT